MNKPTDRWHMSAIGCIVFTFFFTFMASAYAQESSSTAEDKPPITAEDVIETESGLYYTVKEGDTLWSLSKRFADSAYLWPDMWSQNESIANPHLIYPGERILIYRRKDVGPKVEPVEEPPQIVEEEPVEAEAPAIEIPEVEPVKAPEPERSFYRFSGLDKVGFIRKTPVEPHGVIFRVRDPKKMISVDDVVYARHGSQPLTVGSRYTVYRTISPILDPVSRRSVGTQHLFLGVVEVTQSENRFAIARVLRSFINIGVNDKLMPYERRSPKIWKRESSPDVLGEIIKAEVGNKLIGDHVTAFINKGENDGVFPGQRYSIFYQASDRINPSAYRKSRLLNQVAFGEVVVLHTEDTTATVYVTKTDRNITPGNRISTPIQ